MLTETQTHAYLSVLDGADADGVSLLPARVHTLSDVPSEFADEFGDGTLLYVGRVLPDDVVDCDGSCGHDHVEYAIIRADGAASPLIVSGTLMEVLLGPPTLWDDARVADASDFPEGFAL